MKLHAEQTTTPASKRSEWRRPLEVAALGAGLGLLAIAAVLWWQASNVPPVYSYLAGEPLAVGELGPLEALAEQGFPIRSATVVASDTTLARFEFAETERGPVILTWNPRVDAPFLTMLPAADELTALAPVLSRHVPAGTTLLAWWDVSRQLELLAGVDTTFAGHLGLPLFVPREWPRQQAEATEAGFWPVSADPVELERFRAFTHALLADADSGMAQLRELVHAEPAVLVLHARDVILLGQLEPQGIGVAFEDFPASGDVHGMVRTAYDWLKQNEYAAYTVIRPDNGRIRVVGLTDQSSGATLIGRLLPFIGSDMQQEPVPGAKLVYQTGGFWVYELTPEEPLVQAR